MENLMNIGTSLTREEMRMVNGGTVWTCTFTMISGDPITRTYEGTGAEAQCAADHACIGTDSCLDADCSGSGEC